MRNLLPAVFWVLSSLFSSLCFGDYLDVGDENKIWYTVSGKGTPVVFVHGGPGGSIADYTSVNHRLFGDKDVLLVEFDQRGTGKSIPSIITDGLASAPKLENLRIDQLAKDMETLRKHLGIERWLVFGGSWGSTLGLYYAETYPESVSGIILRGIFLNSPQEMESILSKKAWINNTRIAAEFDKLVAPLTSDGKKDAHAIINAYRNLIHSGSETAAYRWYLFEDNLSTVGVPRDIDQLDEDERKKALSVGFHETLFFSYAYDAPINLLEGVQNLKKDIPVWIVQGTGDPVCPETYAEHLLESLKKAKIPVIPRFVEAAGHLASDKLIENALQDSLKEYLSRIYDSKSTRP